MRVALRILSISFLLPVLYSAPVLAQTITPPWGSTWPIVSDFGPRVASGSWFHKGVDYSAAPGDQDFGTPIPAVEVGTVKKIFASSPPYYIRIISANGAWEYFHIFSNNNFVVMEWELRANAQLVNPNNSSEILQDNIIILWSGNRAIKVLCADYPGYWVSEGTDYLLGTDGNRITTKNTVDGNETIAPMGNSNDATIPTHLHLGLNYGTDNPLYYLIHTLDALPTVTIGSPEDNHIFNGTELNSNYPIRADVDSSNGPDLDKVELWVYVNNDPSQAIPVGDTNPAFIYGGQVDEGFTMSTQEPGSNGDETGVMPYEVNGDSLGHDLFVLNQNFSTLYSSGGKLPNGEHSLVVRATDVNGNSAPDVIHHFIIQKPELTYGYVDPPSGDANTDFYYYVYYNDPSGATPAATNVYIDNVPYTMTLYGGTSSDGSYVYGPVRLSAANHNYFFNFSDGLGGTALLPSTGRSPGPTVENYTLIASVNPSGSGTITGPQMNCKTVCSASYVQGTSLTLSAAAADGYIFTGWTGCYSSNDAECTVTMNSDKNISASFASLASVELAWATTFGGSSSAWADSIAYTSDGGSIAAGYDDSSGDAYAMKLDASGNIQWAKTFGGGDEFFSALQTTDGGYFLAGDTYDFGAGSYDALAVKIDSTGNVQWQNAFGGSSAERVGSALKTADGGFAIGGWTYSFGSDSPTYDDLFIIKLDANGIVQWQKAYGGGKYEGAYSIQLTADGGYVAAGVTSSFSDNGSRDAWVVKLDANGNIQWQKTYGSTSGWDEADSIQQTSDGGYIVAGQTASWGAGGFDAWVLKLDANGNIQWQKAYGGSGDDDAASVAQTADGGYIVAGDTYSFGAGGYDAWILKLDEAGNIQWQKAYGGINDDGVSSLQQIPGGGYILAGYTNSYGTATSTWVLKIDSNGNIADNCLIVGTPNAIVTTTSASASNSTAATVDINVITTATSLTTADANIAPTALCAASASNIIVTPTSLYFGSVNIGSSSSQTVTIQNLGDSALDVNSVTLSGTNTSEFSQTNNCSTVAAGSSCQITVTYSPAVSGSKTATLVISHNQDAAPSNVSLNGSSGFSLTVTTSGSGSGTVTSTPEGINCGTNCTVTYQQGSSVTLAAVPDENSVFAGWSGIACSGTRDCTISMNYDMTVAATYNLKTPTADFSASITSGLYPLSVSFTDLTTGTVTSWLWDFGDGTTSSQQNPSHIYETMGNYTVSLTVTNAAGSDTKTKDNYIGATDYGLTYTVTASAGEGGTITPSGSLEVSYRASQAYTITPNTGYHIASVSGCGGTLTGNIYTASSVIADCEVMASFAVNTYSITASASAGGSISPSGTIILDYGSDQTFTITPDADQQYHIADVLVDDVSVGAVQSYQFKSVSTDHKIEARFSKTYTLSVEKVGTETGTVTSNDGGINCGSDCSEDYTPGTTVTLTVNSSSIPFTGWQGACTGTSPTCTVSINENTVVTAQFGEVFVTWARKYSTTPSDATYARTLPTSDGGYILSLDTGIVKISGDGGYMESRLVVFDFLNFGIYSPPALIETADGGFVVAGEGHDHPLHGLFVAKLTKNLSVEWEKMYGQYGDTATSVRQTSDGGYIVTGWVTTYLNDLGGIWVLKLFANGDVDWEKKYGTESQRFRASDVQQTLDGGYIIAGGLDWPESKPLLLKLSSNGDIEWQKIYDQGRHFTSIVQDDLDGGYIGVVNVTGALILKVDSSGNVVGPQKVFADNTSVFPSIVKTADNSGYVVAGTKDSWTPWMFKIDEDGNILWEKTYNPEPGLDVYFIQQTPDNGFVLSCITDYRYGSGVLIIKTDMNGDVGDTDDCSSIVSRVNSAFTETTVTSSDISLIVRNDNTNGTDSSVTLHEYNAGRSGNYCYDTTVAISDISVSPSSLNFGQVNIGATSILPVTITNKGVLPLEIKSIEISGKSVNEYSQTNNCTNVYKDSSCTINVALTAESVGIKKANLNISSNDPDTPTVSIPMSGVNGRTLKITKTGDGTGTVTSSPAGINCGDSCEEAFTQGTQVTLTAAPDSISSTFEGWSGGGCSGTGTCTVTLNADTSISANFKIKPKYTVTVAPTGTGSGTVTSSPDGINCGSDCTESFYKDTIVTLTATPYAGSFFSGWSGGGCSGTGTCTATIVSAATVTAAFNLNTLTVIKNGTGVGSVSSTPSGISCGSDCTEIYNQGTEVTLTATPEADSSFEGWSGGGCSGTGSCTIAMNAAASVTATFNILPPVADFANSTAPGTAPFSVSFSDQSTRPYSWLWDFGDGTTSTLQNPVHIYKASGTFIVSLTVVNPSGEDTKISSSAITVQPCANLPVRINGESVLYFDSLQEAYSAAQGGDVIQSLAVNIDLADSFIANIDKSVSITGGYNCDYTGQVGNTALLGSIATTAGALTMGNIEIVSAITDKAFSVIASAGHGGSISPAGTFTTVEHGSVAYTITADSGFLIFDLLVDGSSVGAVNTYTFNDVTANHKIEAIFSTFNIVTASTGPNGSISPQGATAVALGKSITYMITAAAGYRVADVLVDGQSAGRINSYTFNSVTSDHSISVTFEVNSSPIIADFSGTPTEGFGPLTVAFADLSTENPIQWLWDFGDGATSNLRNPTHTYSAAGNYTVTLTATNTGGSNTMTKTGFVNVLPYVKIAGSTAVYRTIQEAYDAAQDGAVIRVRNMTLTEDINASVPKNITFEGGYNSDFSAIAGATNLSGMITTSAGTVTLGNFILQK